MFTLAQWRTPLPVDQVIEQELGLPWTEVFSSLSPCPVAAASLGQVYRGRLASNGAEVAVKVSGRLGRFVVYEVCYRFWRPYSPENQRQHSSPALDLCLWLCDGHTCPDVCNGARWCCCITLNSGSRQAAPVPSICWQQHRNNTLLAAAPAGSFDAAAGSATGRGRGCWAGHLHSAQLCCHCTQAG